MTNVETGKGELIYFNIHTPPRYLNTDPMAPPNPTISIAFIMLQMFKIKSNDITLNLNVKGKVELQQAQLPNPRDAACLLECKIQNIKFKM